MKKLNNSKILVASPLLPDLKLFEQSLKKIWESKWLTNNGDFHKKFEVELCKYLGVKYLSIYTNGTLPILAALQTLKITGEVITTPYSFVATTHALWWNGIKPVFVDIDPVTGNLDPNKIEAAITPKTTAILPVHVYGNPCETKKIKAIADKYGLKVIYDAAHAFGVKVNGKSILNEGDLSTLSFHATKVFSTFEGGALISHNKETKQRIEFLKNFGFANEVTVVGPGINGKMDEARAAYGLLNLRQVDAAIERRKAVAKIYREELKDIRGIRYMSDMKGVRHNYAYFPIFVDEKEFGVSRDALYEGMKKFNVFGRRYFYPLISTFSTYRGLPSATPSNLPVATKLADTVICLPMHHDLSDSDVERVIDSIKKNCKK
ncbi:MAG: DegT/DnrJ/EryC1/StrS family aminotransferase [Bacteroidales bacterium]|jgi:dTDP-4-amino-4,6-dideoxygalactose transaminase|nr:DegT/DnrJ/EryC1/StrS family aminotransferase [Bacteroidales bacterium]